MELYECNLELLKKYRPNLLEQYEKSIVRKEINYPCESIEAIAARDGSVIFCVEREGQKVRLNSPYRPLPEAEKWAEQFKTNNVMVNAMLFGFGNGMFAEALLARLKNDAKLFIYEPSLEIFDFALHTMNLEQLIRDERVFFCFEDINPEEFENLIQENTHWTNLETQIYGYHTGYDILFPEAYRNFLMWVHKTDQMAKVNKDTQAFFAESMVSNILYNLKYVKEGRIITDYIASFPHDVPAIIVAAGPSLDKNINELKKAKGKAFILAVDTAMRHLLQHDIIPDAMITLDPRKPFSYMDNPLLKDIPLFCMMVSNSEIMEFHTGIKIFFQTENFLNPLYEKYGKRFTEYNPGGSVATAAFSVCVALEFQRIVLVGQDLAYSGDTTHAGGEVSHVVNEEYGIKMIEGIDGKKIKSRYDWVIYRDWFEESIKSIEDRVEVIDATEGGAMIHGCKLLTLKEVIEKYCIKPVDFEKILKDQQPAWTSEQFVEVKKKLNEYAEQIFYIEKKAQQTEKDCGKAVTILKEHLDSQSLNRIQQRLLSVTSELEDLPIYHLLDLYMSNGVNEYLSGVFIVGEDQREDEINTYRSSQKIFENLMNSARKLKTLYRKAIEEI